MGWQRSTQPFLRFETYHVGLVKMKRSGVSQLIDVNCFIGSSVFVLHYIVVPMFLGRSSVGDLPVLGE